MCLLSFAPKERIQSVEYRSATVGNSNKYLIPMIPSWYIPWPSMSLEGIAVYLLIQPLSISWNLVVSHSRKIHLLSKGIRSVTCQVFTGLSCHVKCVGGNL